MRDYPHRPDEPFLQTRITQFERGIGTSATRISAGVDADELLVYNSAVGTAFTLARLQWALERPLDDVVASMRQAVTWMREAIAKGFEVGATNIDRWLEIAIIGGDPAAAATVVDLIDRGVVDLGKDREAEGWFLAGLRALLQGDRDAATNAAESLRRWLDAPDTAPFAAQSLAGLDLLIGATASGDQAAFDDGVAIRRQARVAAFGRSVQLRRNPDGLLDAAGAAVARLAALRGRSLPPGDPYLATDLLAALPWPRSGG
jgi:hypothetical protein